jgi:hypothetical protein
VYLTLAVGVVKTTHYCMGRENHSSIFSYHTESCGCSLLSGGLSSCCDNESVLLRVDDDQSASAQLTVQPVQLPLIVEWELYEPEDLNHSFDQAFYPEKFLRPPPQKAYIKNCSLVFYDEEELA